MLMKDSRNITEIATKKFQSSMKNSDATLVETFTSLQPCWNLMVTFTITKFEVLEQVGQFRGTANKVHNAFLEVELELMPLGEYKYDALLCFKNFDCGKQDLRYVGRIFVKGISKPTEILGKLNEMAGYASVQEIELYEVVHFRSLDKPKEQGFCLELSRINTYDEVLGRIARQLELDDPSQIRLIFHNCYSQQSKPPSIKYRGVDNLVDMLVHYYEFESSHPDAEPRLLKVFYYKIYKIFLTTEKIENINDQYWILWAKEALLLFLPFSLLVPLQGRDISGAWIGPLCSYKDSCSTSELPVPWESCEDIHTTTNTTEVKIADA